MNLTKKQILIIAAVIIILVGGYFLLRSGLRTTGNVKELTIWGPVDDQNVILEMSKKYTQETGNKVIYKMIDPNNYEQTLISSLAAGTGPDIFYFKNDWLYKHYKIIVPAPTSLFTQAAISDVYAQAVVQNFTSNGYVYAMPLYLDSLAMFYNQELLDQAAISFPPKTWEELVNIIPLITKKDLSGNILISGVALGTANNVAHSADILSLLFIQSGAPLATIEPQKNNLKIEFESSGKSDALSFYTQFAKPESEVYTWNEYFGNSLDEFAKGKVAIVFGYAKDIKYLRSIAPYFNFKIAPMPQPKNATLIKNYASYWGLAVSKQSPNKTEAWNLINYLMQNDSLQTYSLRTNLPPAKRTLLQALSANPIFDVFNRQSYTALNWYNPDPEKTEIILNQAINDVLKNKMASYEAIRSIENQISKLFSN